MNKARIGDRIVGVGEPCFITLEAGPTHDGLVTAKQLVDVAVESGADAVKFQIFDPDHLVADKKLPFKYDILVDKETGKTETVEEPLYDILCRRCMPESDWMALKQYCDQRGVLFFSTVSDDSYYSMIKKMQLPSLKVASADVDHRSFIRRLAHLDTCIQLDTGNATIGEVEEAVDVLRVEGCDNFIIHNCPSGYPARLSSINLRLLQTIQTVFECPAAFSDHTPGWDMDVAALALGANMLEKTISLDRMTPGVEHVMSLEKDDAKKFVQVVRDVEIALGSPRRKMTTSEKDSRKAVRRSVFLAQDGRQGQALKDLKVEFRRPGFGLPAGAYDECLELTLKQDMAAGSMIKRNDLG